MSETEAVADAPADAPADPTPDAPDNAEAADEGGDDDEPIRNMGELRKVRKELKESREKYGPLADALSGFDDNDLDFIVKEWLPSFHSDQEKFVGYTKQILEQMTPAEKAEAKADASDAIEEATEAKGSALTAEEVRKIVAETIAEAEQSKAAEAEIKAIYDDLKRNGIEDHDSIEAQQVMFIAMKQTGGDIDKAVEILAAKEQEAIDKFLASKGEGPTVPPKGSSASPVKDQPQNLAEARKMAHAALEQRFGR